MRLNLNVFDNSDSRAIKTGYDPVQRCWPSWLRGLGVRVALLPEVVEPGTPIGAIDPALATRFGHRVVEAGAHYTIGEMAKLPRLWFDVGDPAGAKIHAMESNQRTPP